MRQEITKTLMRVKSSCSTGFLTVFSSSNTHILFPPPSLTAACVVVEFQHLISSPLSICLFFPSQCRVSCTGRMMVQAVNQRGRSQRSTPGHMRRWGLTDRRGEGGWKQSLLVNLLVFYSQAPAAGWHMCCRLLTICTTPVFAHAVFKVCCSDVKRSKKQLFTQMFALSWFILCSLLNCPFRKEKLRVNVREHLFALLLLHIHATHSPKRRLLKN